MTLCEETNKAHPHTPPVTTRSTEVPVRPAAISRTACDAEQVAFRVSELADDQSIR
jgi:hypothetical protein